MRSGLAWFRLTPLWSLLALSCGGGVLDSFPPPATVGVEVMNPTARLGDAVQEYLELQGLPVRGAGLRGNVVETDWFTVADLETGATPLAVCPAVSEQADPRYRARYRFSISPRAGSRLFQVEAHWQRASGTDLPREPAWQDCRSTGSWERAMEERLVLRAELMG